LTVQPREGATVEDIGPGISSTVLRRIDFAGLSELWRASRDVGIAMDDLRAALRSAATQGVTDGYLALLSAAYVTLVQAGRPSVTVALADLVGRQPETIRQHLVRARNAGMLTSVRGAAGGQLTDKARSVLGQFDDELFDRSDGS
jgi:predicted component of type VI protein secretion system